MYSSEIRAYKGDSMARQTTKANGLEPYAYLRRLFEWLAHANTVADYEAPLPFAAFATSSVTRWG